MRYGFAFLLLGIGFTAQAVARGGWWWLLVWPGLSFAVVGVAYLLSRPQLLGKRADGRLSSAALPYMLPFALFAWIVWHARRLAARRKPVAAEIAPGIWLGRRAGACELPAGVTTVVDLTAEFWEPRGVVRDRCYVCVPILDASATDESQFRAALDAILAAESAVYIHCAQGHGRSAALAAAVLIRRGLAADVDEGENALARLRPGVGLYPSQRELVRRVTSLH